MFFYDWFFEILIFVVKNLALFIFIFFDHLFIEMNSIINSKFEIPISKFI
jgi:hypothetical protein